MKRTALIISALSLIIISTDAFAAKLVWMKVVDCNYIMAQFKDGDVNFADSNQGTYAYTGTHYTGWDWVVSYGTALNTTNAVATANWVIKSTNDANYSTTGLNPTNCYRKSKLNGMSEGSWNMSTSDYDYYYTMEHAIYLKLPYSLVQGKTYTIEINSNTNSDTLSKALNFDIFNSPSEAVHVNLVDIWRMPA